MTTGPWRSIVRPGAGTGSSSTSIRRSSSAARTVSGKRSTPFRSILLLMRSGHSPLEIASERFDAPDVVLLTEAQQEEMRDLYEGVGDIGPSRDAAMFEPPHGLFL